MEQNGVPSLSLLPATQHLSVPNIMSSKLDACLEIKVNNLLNRLLSSLFLCYYLIIM